MIPTNLNDLVLNLAPILSIGSLPILSDIGSGGERFFGLKRIHLVFLAFKVSLLARNQSPALDSNLLALLTSDSRLLSHISSVVSSANR